MFRKTLLVAILGLSLALAGHSPAEDVKKDTKESTAKIKGNPLAGKVAPYVHAVIFRLNKDAPPGAAEALIKDSHALLAKIPSVRRLWVGRPADKATPIARKDYEVGLLMMFDNAAGLEEYLEHPLHLQFINKHGKTWDNKKISIYDFVNQTK
jgi:Stress responsive A/B Barrel Domain